MLVAIETRKTHGASKYRIDAPQVVEAEKTFLLQNFGCARKVYNLYVDYLYQKLEEIGFVNGPLPEIKLPELTYFKNQEEYAYLKKADSLALCNAKIAFEQAVSRYNDECDHKTYTKRALRRAASGTEALSFRGLKGMPKFHSRAHGDFSYTTNNQKPTAGNGLKQDSVRLQGNMLHVPKIKADLPLILHRPLPAGYEIGNVTLSMDTDGALYASIEYTFPVAVDTRIREAAANNDTSILDELSFIGLDYSQKDFYMNYHA